MSKKVGLIGVGIMGKLMIEKLQANGYTVIASDPSVGAQEFCKEKGVEVASSNADLASKVNRIVCCLPNPAISIAVAKELVGHVTSDHIVMEVSTVMPSVSVEIGEIYKASEATFVEGAILGRPAAVGNWTIIAGGDEEAIKVMEPIHLSYASRVVRAGDVGSANGIKVLNNTMFCIFNAAIAEVFVIAENAGVDQKAFYEIVANSQAATNCGVFREIGRRIVEDRYEQPDATMFLAKKDNGCGVSVAHDNGISPLIATTSLMAFENAVSTGLGDLDSAAIYQYLRSIYPTK